MTPGARVAATIELLDEIVSRSERPADLVLNAFFRARRYIGSGDRRAVAERLWGILRRYGQLYWWLERTRHPALTAGSLARGIVAADLFLVDKLELRQVEAMFDGGTYRPAPLDEAELRALRQMEGHSLPHPDQPDWVRLNVQEWVAPHLQEAYGEAWGREIAALETPPPVDLRVNRLKATVEEAQAALKREGIETEPMRYASDGLRLKRRLSVVRGEAFQNGLVEIQDEGSQLVAALVDAQPGMQVADYCAGAGGKTLAMAAGMNNKGRVVAMDVLETRLDRSAQRLRRAGAHNVERRAIDADNRKWLKRQAGAFDRVLVDAPCTGSGTWRQKPRRALDAPARGSGRAGAEAGGDPRCRIAPGEAGRRPHIRHLLGAAGRERAAGRSLPGTSCGFRRRAGGRHLARVACQRAAARGRGRTVHAPLAAAPRHRRLLRRDAGAQGGRAQGGEGRGARGA